MLLTAGAVEVLQFIRILSWIIIPLLAAAIGLTIFFHYRKKKRNLAKDESADTELPLVPMESVSHKKSDGEYIYFDHSGVIREYKERLTYNHARFAALQQDFANLEGRFTSLARFTAQSYLKHKKENMKNFLEQLPPSLQDEITKLEADHQAEKSELTAQLEQLGRSYQSLQDENESLLEQMSMSTATEDEKAALVSRWQKENVLLKDRIAEQEYLKDILDEKKAQIDFLQEQLEQRIRHQHQSEHVREQAVLGLESMRGEKLEAEQVAEDLRAALALKQDQVDKLHMHICEKEEQINDRQQVLASKLDQITYLENTLHGLKEQNEMLNASVADSNELVAALQNQLADEQSRAEYADQKLAANKQMIRRLYKEFSMLVDEDQPPVIPLRAPGLEPVKEYDEEIG
jgi:chromosome segregation ATPase